MNSAARHANWVTLNVVRPIHPPKKFPTHTMGQEAESAIAGRSSHADPRPCPDVFEQMPSGAGGEPSPHRRRTKQRLTLLIETAFSRDEGGIVQAGIIQRTVPAAPLAPFAPGEVVAILAVGISGFSGCTKEALAGMGGSGDEVPCHHGGRECGKKGDGSAKKSEFCHVFLPESGQHEDRRPKSIREIPPAVPKRYLKLSGLPQPSVAPGGI